MNSINKLFDYRRAGYVIAAFAVLLATALPSLAMAAQLNQRSIVLGNSSADADAVAYQVNFTPVTTDTGAVVIQFCSDSPALGASCAAPTGFSAAGAATSGGFAIDGTPTANKVVVTGTFTAATPATINLTNINNPTAAGSLYARIVTFDSNTNAQAYTAASTTSATGYRDHGGVAMYITPTIGVSGAVAETLIFCASNAAISDNCGGADAPNVILGEDGILGNTLSEGTIHSQISTNAVSGAVVNLKSSAIGCGGLLRAGTGTSAERCGIGPKTAIGVIANGDSLFGVRLANPNGGTGTIEASGDYEVSATDFLMNYNSTDESTGVTSTYGDPLFNTDDAPISNGEIDLVFGANIGNDTPAGSYSANLSLIATGKF